MELRSVAEVRELLGAEAIGMTDAEVLEVRDQMVAFAQLLVRSYTARGDPAGQVVAYPRRLRASAPSAHGARQDLRGVPDTKGAAQ